MLPLPGNFERQRQRLALGFSVVLLYKCHVVAVRVAQSHSLALTALQQLKCSDLHKICVFVACRCLYVANDDDDGVFFPILRFTRMTFAFTPISYCRCAITGKSVTCIFGVFLLYPRYRLQLVCYMPMYVYLFKK